MSHEDPDSDCSTQLYRDFVMKQSGVHGMSAKAFVEKHEFKL